MGNYHLSRYDIILPFEDIDGKALLANGVYGAYDVVPLSCIDSIKSGGEGLGEELFERLKKRGHLVKESAEEELKNASLLTRCWWLLPYRSIIDLVIMPTYNCNFRCDYCYERKRLEKGNEWLGHSMSDEVLDAVFTQIDEYIRQGRHIRNVFLYGGEPLLRTNKKQVEYIINACHDREIKLICVTNGYDLDGYIDILEPDWFDFLQITVDGPREVHDKRRYLAGGQGSYEKIMKNISLVLEKGLRVHLRTNINRSNLESVMELPKEFEKRGFLKYPNFYWYFKATIGCFEDDPNNAITDLEMYETMKASGIDKKTALQHCMLYGQITRRVGGALAKETYPPLRPAACGAESDMLVVDPDGKLYTCWDVVSMEEYTVGYTDLEAKRFRFDLNFPKWRGRTADRLEDCEACPMMMVCGGGCAIESEHAYGTMNKGFCGTFKEAFEEVVPYICSKKYKESGEKELSGSWYDLLLNITDEEKELLLSTMSQLEAQKILKKYLNRYERIFR